MDIPEDREQDYEAMLEDADRKTILFQMLMELGAIRRQLETQNQRLSNDPPDTYRCDYCSAEVAKEEREQHAKQEHDMPDTVDLAYLFEPA